jgi:hypothetical protein
MKKTNFYICRNDTIQVIQGNFSHFYPSLDINFFSNNEKNILNNSCVMFSPEVQIRDINPDCQDGCIEINDNMTIDELENLIQDNFNLHAEISSKISKRPVTILQTQRWLLKEKSPEGVRLPERSHAIYFKNVPSDC